MFGSNPFGQSSSSNPFAPKSFGSSTSSFSSQTGSSLFGGMSTGVFGGQSSSPVGSTSVFGASSSPAFGSSTLTFGGSTGSAFGNTSSAFGGSSAFGATQPSFGGFGSNTTQASPFGSSFQQPQPAFGNTFSSSTPFGASSSPAFGATSSSAFGAPSTPAFGSTSTPAFGSTTSPTFGSTSGGFGASSSPFGSSTQVFGAPSASAFGASGTPAFGATATPAFGATTTPAFGASAAPAFGASSNPSFNLGSSPAFGQSTSAFGSSPFGATPSFGAPSTSFGTQTTAQTFGSLGLGQSAFGGQRGGTRVSPYSATLETDTGTQPAGKLQSISAMPVYKDKSHEELRWEDYQLQDKGGPAPAGQATAAGSFGSSGFGATQSATFSQAPANPFPSATSSNPFAPKQTAFNNSNFGSATGSAFGSSPFATSNTSNLFGSASSATASLFGSTAQPFGANPSSSVFNSSGSSAFGSPSIFGASSSQGTTSGLSSGLGGIGNTQSSPLFQSATPTLGQTSSPFGQTSSAFGQTTSAFGKTNLFNTPSTGFGGTSSLLSSTSTSTLGFGQTTPSLSTPFQSAQQAPGAINFSNFGQSQAAGTSGFGGTPSIFGNAAFGQAPFPQSSAAAQAPPIANPFGTLPMVPQVFGHAGTSPSMQYGISSLQVFEKPTTVRMSSPLTSRHLSQRRMQLTVRKYHPNTNSLKVAFFKDEEETESTPKADAQFVPRENPRALMIRPMEQWHSRSTAEKTKTTNTLLHENATPTKDPLENDLAKEELNPSKFNRKPNDIHDGLSTEKGDSYITRTGHRAGEAAIVYEHGAGIETLMPKLRHSDYYTEPRIQELAAKERAEPGYCRCVKNFVVGRNEYGSIKFSGETDVRRLDLESLIQFNNREVVVYMDESKKPPVGQGLNKAAEVTLLNIKCFDKKTGRQYTEGPRIEKYKEMLKRKAEDQGAEFVSYDAVKGEWKFRVSHFSTYKLGEEDDCSESVHV